MSGLGILFFSLTAAFTPIRVHQGPAGFVVLHFGPSTSDCQQEVKSNARSRALFQGFRTPAGELLTITGHVALRFKASTSARQIDSLISASGVEAFSTLKRSGCRRYALAVVQPGDDANQVASALEQGGLVDYATPDLSAGRSEGVSRDSFFVDQLELASAMSRNGIAASVAPLLPSKYGMGQVLGEYTGPLMRVEGPAISAQLSSANSSASALDLVRSHGITTLRLDIPDRGPTAKVQVLLYSLNGTPVRRLVSETLAAGQYIVGWDGLDDKGRRAQPGVYVAVMTAGNFRETHRLVVR